MRVPEVKEPTPLEVVLTFLIHVLAVFGSVALAHHFFPGSPTWMFFIVLGGVLLINWHRNPDPKHSVIGWLTIVSNRGKVAIQKARPKAFIDNLPPEKEPKKT